MKWPRRRRAAALPSPPPAQETPMMFRYTDPLGDALFIARASNEEGPVVSFRGVMRGSGEITVVHVPLAQVEEVIAGIRDAARQPAADTAVPLPSGEGR